MNKYAFTFLIAVSTGLIWSQSASAEVSVYGRNNSPYASMYPSSNGQSTNSTANSATSSAANKAAEASIDSAQRESEMRMEEYRMNMQDMMMQNRNRAAGMPPYIYPPEEEEPKKKVKREVLEKKQAVNGISGTWLPKKVWENDIDNDLGRTLLKNSTHTSSTSSKKTTQQPFPGQRDIDYSRASNRRGQRVIGPTYND